MSGLPPRDGKPFCYLIRRIAKSIRRIAKSIRRIAKSIRRIAKTFASPGVVVPRALASRSARLGLLVFALIPEAPCYGLMRLTHVIEQGHDPANARYLARDLSRTFTLSLADLSHQEDNTKFRADAESADFQ
jgi:hypothetical protein